MSPFESTTSFLKLLQTSLATPLEWVSLVGAHADLAANQARVGTTVGTTLGADAGFCKNGLRKTVFLIIPKTPTVLHRYSSFL